MVVLVVVGEEWQDGDVILVEVDEQVLALLVGVLLPQFIPEFRIEVENTVGLVIEKTFRCLRVIVCHLVAVVALVYEVDFF